MTLDEARKKKAEILRKLEESPFLPPEKDMTEKSVSEIWNEILNAKPYPGLDHP